MNKVLLHRSSDVKETHTGNKRLKSVFNKFDSNSDPQMERIHVENVNPNGRTLRESSVHNNILYDVARHRDKRFRNKEFFHIDRVHVGYVEEFGKRRLVDQDRRQNLINNRFPSLAEARDQYLRQTFQAPARMNDETTNAQSASNELAEGTSSPLAREVDQDAVKSKAAGAVAYVDPNADPSLLTQKQRAQLYLQNDSPRKLASTLVRDHAFALGAGESPLRVHQFAGAAGWAKNDPGTQEQMGNFSTQTMVSSIKTKALFRNPNHRHVEEIDGLTPQQRLIRPNEPLRRTVEHHTELPEQANANLDDFKYTWKDSRGMSVKAQPMGHLEDVEEERRQQGALTNYERAQTLEEIGEAAARVDQHPIKGQYLGMNYKSMMYNNEHHKRTRRKESLYDYQQIQSTQPNSQVHGQRHFMFGGPTSGHDSYLNQTIHVQKFTRSSPSPAKHFDETRGASCQINSYNSLNQYMPHQKEFPRLTVLQNFKEINRIMTSNFLKNKQLEEKYHSRLPKFIKQKMDIEHQATNNMTNIMKKMHSPRNFTSPLQKVGSVQNYQNCQLARSIMLETEQKRSVGAFSQKQKLNFNSLMHNSSQFDRGNLSTTVDGTQLSNLNYYEQHDNADPLEQKHNSINLALGKPTQSFRGSEQRMVRKNIYEGALNSLQGTTADSIAFGNSSQLAGIQKHLPNGLHDESILSSEQANNTIQKEDNLNTSSVMENQVEKPADGKPALHNHEDSIMSAPQNIQQQ